MDTARLQQPICDQLKHADVKAIVLLLGPHWLKAPPLSLAYLENFLGAHKIKVTTIDLNALFFHLFGSTQKEWLALDSAFEKNLLARIDAHAPGSIEHIINLIAQSPARIVGFSMFARNRAASIQFAQRLSAACPRKLLVFGGPETLFEYHRPQFFPEITHPHSYFVVGEGELPFLSIAQQGAYPGIKSTTHHGKNIFIHKEIDSLDKLPLLDFDCVNLDDYMTKTLPILSSRGCIRRCTFCAEHALFRNFRQHSPDYMVKLLRTLTQRYQRTTFSFHDSLLNANNDWLEEFCSLLIREKLSIRWEAQMMIRNNMNEALFELMKQSGCYNIFIGFESASDKILRQMHKGFTQKEALDFFKKLHRHGLQFEISLITGFPQESEEDFNETFSFLRENKSIIPKIAQVNPFVGYAPSAIRDQNNSLREAARDRVNRLLEMFDQENIKFTHSFINNLVTQ